VLAFLLEVKEVQEKLNKKCVKPNKLLANWHWE
jgi:hypothetical protein